MRLTFAVIILGLTASVVNAQSNPFPDFATALKAGDAATDFKQSEPIFNSLASYPMRCQDARAAYDWLNNVKLDASNDGQMQIASRRAGSVAKALSRATSSDCHEFIAKTLKAESRWLLASDMSQLVKAATGSRKGLFESAVKSERVRAVIAAAGDGKNEQALENLRTIQKQGGAFSEPAVYALGHIGHAEDLDRFIAILKKNPRARLNISEFGTPVIPRIMKEVDDPSVTEAEKNSLIGAIKWAGGHESMPLYLRLIRHPNSFVSRVAAEGMARVATPADEGTLKQLINDSNAEVRYNALQGLNNNWKNSYTPIFISVMESDQRETTRGAAARFLGDHRACEAEPALKRALNDGKWVNQYAQSALKQLRNEQNLLPQKPTKKPEMSDELKRVFAAGAVRARAKLDTLINTVSDPHAEVGTKALAWSELAQAVDPKALNALIRIASGSNIDDGTSALSTIGSTLRNATYTPGLSPEDIAKAKEYLKSVASDTVPLEGNQRIRFIIAAEALNAAGERESVYRASERLIQTGDNNVFRNIEIDDGSLPFILRVANGKYAEHIRFTAIGRLAQAGYKDEAIPLLAGMVMNGKDRMNRYNCLRMLWQIGDEKAKEEVTKAKAIPELQEAASNFLNTWIGRCPE